jgi:stress response protein SCP2
VSTELVKGQNVPWPHPVVTVRVHHPGDVSALLLGPDRRVRSSADLAFYNQPVAGAATWSAGPPQQVHVALEDVDAGVETVLVVVSTDPGTPPLGAVAAPRVELLAADGQVAGFTPTGLSTERALVVCEVYRRAGAWKVRAVGQGYDGGLAEAVTVHGVEVDDPPPAPPPAAHQPPPPPTAAAPTAAAPPPPGTSPHERLARQAAGILEDASRSTASLRSTSAYAATRLERTLEELVADPRTRSGPQGDLARAAAQRDHDALVATARANHARDMAQLRQELAGLEASLPAPMAAWASPAWQDWRPATDRSPALRIGTLDVEDAPGLAVPMLVGLPLHLPVWVDGGSGGPLAAARVLRAVGARVLASAPPGTFRVTVLDVGGTNPAPVPGLGPVATDPAAAATALEELVRHIDMVEMAYQSGHPEVLEEMDVRPRLLLAHDVPTGLDDHAVVLLHQVVDRGAEHGVQVVLSATESEAVANPLLTLLLRSCRAVPSGDGGVLTDGYGGTSWAFSPDLGPDDPAPIEAVVPRLVRP